MRLKEKNPPYQEEKKFQKLPSGFHVLVPTIFLLENNPLGVETQHQVQINPRPGTT